MRGQKKVKMKEGEITERDIVDYREEKGRKKDSS